MRVSTVFDNLPTTVVVVADSERTGLLTACLESLTACAPRAAEILVTDPTGTDAAAEAVRRFGDDTVRIVPGMHASRGAALNAALRLAANDIVLLTNDDCIASASWVASGWSRVAANPAVLVTGQVLPLEDSRRVPTNMHAPRPNMFPPMTNWGEVHGWVMACSRDRVLDAGGFDEGSPMAEDLELRYRLGRSGLGVEYAPEVIVWRQNWRSERQLRQLARVSAVQRGALYAKYARLGDRRAVRLAAAELRAGVRSLAAALRHRRRSWSDPRRGILYGLPAGLARGFRRPRP
ncbi:MAG: glycosyltransferase family 2 protein [Gaiellaceae bacterium]